MGRMILKMDSRLRGNDKECPMNHGYRCIWRHPFWVLQKCLNQCLHQWLHQWLNRMRPRFARK